MAAGYGFTLPVPMDEDDLYFYHTDHLGSTSYITDSDANPTQFVCYMPFGQSFVDEHSTRAEMPFKFNGKELDSETGLYYYGARYYEPEECRWYGVDPMTEKMPAWGAYTYAFNNPVDFIDLLGLIPWPVKLTKDGNTRKVTSGMYRNLGGALHGAVDIAFLKNGQGVNQNVNAEVVATHTGTINVFKDRGKAGNYITITNGNIRTRYLHLQGNDLGGDFTDGETVQEGQKIGLLGQSGTNNPHLHYEVQELIDGKWSKINPVTGNQDKVSYSDDVQLIDPQKMLGLPSISDSMPMLTKTERLTFSAPNWAKNSLIGAHIYFIFTGKDPGIPDQYQNNEF